MLQSNWMLMGESQESTQVIEVPLSPRARSPPSFPPPAWPQDILQHFLQGEQKRECFGPVGERRGGMQQGILCLSDAFLYYSPQLLNNYISRVPLWAIHRVTLSTTASALPTTARSPLDATTNNDALEGATFLEVACKTLQVFQFIFYQPDAAVQCQKILQELCFSSTQSHAFAFRHEHDAGARAGYRLFEWKTEFDRLGLDPNEWRITEANQSYQLVPSYPAQFIVPTALTDHELKEIALFRSSGRMPVLSWRHANGASMTRCSQPLVGILWARSLADEKLLESIRQLNPSTQSPLKIVDCRSLISAYANKAKRGGTESLTYYKNCAIEFMGIDNIHVMRESMRCVEHWTTEQTRRPSDLTWLQHVSCVLTAACKIAKELDQGTSVLIHCSDGWDRTAQLSSLVQILLDPYFRTLEGFLVLIEKEWVQLGHKFAERVGHGRPGFWTEHECSPVFLQFLDCVYQLMGQFPSLFEFSHHLLWEIMENVYGCLYGTFLFNNERERACHRVKEVTPSLWSAIQQQVQGPRPWGRPSFLNEKYDDSVSPSTSMVSTFDVQQVQWWPYYYWTEGARLHTNEYAHMLFTLPEKPEVARAYLNHLFSRAEELFGELNNQQSNARYHVTSDGSKRLVVDITKNDNPHELDDARYIEDYPESDLPQRVEEFFDSPFVMVPRYPPEEGDEGEDEDDQSSRPFWAHVEFCTSLLAQLISYPGSVLPSNRTESPPLDESSRSPSCYSPLSETSEDDVHPDRMQSMDDE